jgi:hypothetical protein
MVPILSQINPIHITPTYLRSSVLLSTHLGFGVSSGLFPSGFPTNILYIPILPIRATCHAHLILFNLMILISH